MKTFKQILSEVAEPNSPDERRFKAKHVIKKIDHPTDKDSQETIFKGKKSKDKSVEASYEDDEDEAVYESTRKKAPSIKPDFIKTQRQKDNQHDDAMGRTKTGRKKPVRRMTSTRRSIASMREEESTINEAVYESFGLKKVSYQKAHKLVQSGKTSISLDLRQGADEDIRDGLFELQRKNMISLSKSDGNHPLKVVYKFKKLPKFDSISESYINEAVKAGNMTLSDGTVVKLTSEDAQLMNDLFSELNSTNQSKMEEEMMKSKDGFNKILKFAKEAS